MTEFDDWRMMVAQSETGEEMRNTLAVWVYSVLVLGGLLALTPGSRAQIAAGSVEMKPGLAVCYMFNLVRHIDEFAGWDMDNKCEPGAPLADLDWSVGEGKVLTSNSTDGVMAKITGFIHLDKAGSYRFTVESNDGVRLMIDGKLIVDDPDVHSDRYSEIGTMDVTKPGWYPLTVYYFERKSTSTLRLFWRPPGTEGTFPLVPGSALAH